MQGKTAIVTGAASGIGLAVSQSLAASGVQVVVADLNEEAGQAEAGKIGALFVRADLSRQADCRALVDAALDRYGRVDILVNNAGIQHVSPIEEFPEEKWEFMINLMLTAPFRLMKYVWPGMKEAGWGRIININSVHGLVASPFKSAYISAKHGMSGLTKTAALEGGKSGITANSICPAYVRTPLFTPVDYAFARDGIAGEANPNTETLVIADVDLDQLRRHRYEGATQPWSDRRTDLYDVTWKAGDERGDGEKGDGG
jgi:3-hydroxybutyrate dehydrogenase